MRGFETLCTECNQLSVAERMRRICELSAKLFTDFSSQFGNVNDFRDSLAGFLIGFSVKDGKINEKEYLMLYPALIRVFGDFYPFATVKKSFQKDGRQAVVSYIAEMRAILGKLSEETVCGIAMVCLCVLVSDKKSSYREREYISQLFRTD